MVIIYGWGGAANRGGGINFSASKLRGGKISVHPFRGGEISVHSFRGGSNFECAVVEGGGANFECARFLDLHRLPPHS